MKYLEIRPQLKTGDCLLFDGKGHISELIKRISRGPWSHIAMVVVVNEFNIVGLWESTMLSTQADLDSGQYRKGVQFVDLSARLRGYEGRIAVRQLEKPLDSVQLKRLARLRHEFKDRPYERNMIELARSAYDGFLGNNREESLASLFCSELFAEGYQRMELLPEVPYGLPSNEYTPSDFGECRDLQLLDNRLGPEIEIEV